MTKEEIDLEYKEVVAGMDIEDHMDKPPPNIPRAVRDYGDATGWDEETILKKTILIQRKQLKLLHDLRNSIQFGGETKILKAKGISITQYGRE